MFKQYTYFNIQDKMLPKKAIWIFGIWRGSNFTLTNIFDLAEDLRDEFNKPVDVFEKHGVNTESQFFYAIIKKGCVKH